MLLLTDPDYPAQVAAGTAAALDTQRPVSVLVSMVSIIIMLPAVLLAMLVLGMRPIGRIWSVAARMRWGLLGRLFVISVLAIAVILLIIDMLRRIRRARYRDEVNEELDLAEEQARQATRDSDIDDQDIDPADDPARR